MHHKVNIWTPKTICAPTQQLRLAMTVPVQPENMQRNEYNGVPINSISPRSLCVIPEGWGREGGGRGDQDGEYM